MCTTVFTDTNECPFYDQSTTNNNEPVNDEHSRLISDCSLTIGTTGYNYITLIEPIFTE